MPSIYRSIWNVHPGLPPICSKFKPLRSLRIVSRLISQIHHLELPSIRAVRRIMLHNLPSLYYQGFSTVLLVFARQLENMIHTSSMRLSIRNKSNMVACRAGDDQLEQCSNCSWNSSEERRIISCITRHYCYLLEIP